MCKTIHQKVKFKAPPQEIYNLLADAKLHAKVTGHKTTISRAVGGKFSLYSGHIKGINVDFDKGKRIVQAWRTTKFPKGIFSMVTVTLNGTKDGGTELDLIHRGVPKNLIPDIEQGWRKFYWEKIKTYIG